MVEILIALTLTILALVCWVCNILGLPGNWFLVGMAGLCLLRPEEQASHFAILTVGLLFLVAAIGEALEFIASALGVSRLGASRLSAFLSIGGSIVGAIVGLFFGTLIPIPIVGNLIASLILGAVGAFGGAAAGERWSGKEWDESIEVGNAAFWGRILGTVAKAACGTMACGIFLVAIWI